MSGTIFHQLARRQVHPQPTGTHGGWGRRRPGVGAPSRRPAPPPQLCAPAPRGRGLRVLRRSARLVWPHAGGWRGGTRPARGVRRGRRRGALPKGRHARPRRSPRATSLPAQIRTPPPHAAAGLLALARCRHPPTWRVRVRLHAAGRLSPCLAVVSACLAVLPPDASRRALCRALGRGPRAWSPRGAERGRHPHHRGVSHARPARRVRDATARATHTCCCLARGHLPAREVRCWTPPLRSPPRDLRAPLVRRSVFPAAPCHPARGCAIRGCAAPPCPAPPRPRPCPRLCRTGARTAAAGTDGARPRPPSWAARLGSRQLRGVPALAKPVACGAPCGLPTDRPAPRSVSARARHGVVCCLPIARWPAAAAPAACSFHRHGAGWQGLTVGRGWRRLLVGGGSSTRDHLVVLSAHVRCIPRLVTASVGRGPDSAHFVCVRARTGQGDVELGPDVDPTAAPFVAAAC